MRAGLEAAATPPQPPVGEMTITPTSTAMETATVHEEAGETGTTTTMMERAGETAGAATTGAAGEGEKGAVTAIAVAAIAAIVAVAACILAEK